MSVKHPLQIRAPCIKRWSTLLVLLVFMPAACSLPMEDLQAGVDTAIAKTVMVQLTLTSLGAVPVIPLIDTPSASTVLISVSVDTNCRSGPDQQYDGLGILHVGEQAEVVGKNTVANYWVIMNPDAPGTCWLWGMYATVEGAIDLLPEMTPPPTPTPPPATATNTVEPRIDYVIIFAGVCDFSGSLWLNFQVTNTGNVALESAETRIVDNTSHTTLYGPGTSDKPFRNDATCTDDTLVERVGAGSSLYISYHAASVVSGHSVAASFKICSQNGLSGLCAEKLIHFILP